MFGDLDTREVSIDIMTMLFRSIQGIWSARASGVEMPYEWEDWASDDLRVNEFMTGYPNVHFDIKPF